MKAINLKNYSNPDKTSVYTERRKYSVFLYWDQSALFTDKNDVKTFLAEVNRLLNYSLMELIEIYSELHREFWKIWFYLETHEQHDIHYKNQIEYQLSAVPAMFNLLVERSGWANGNFIVFSSFMKIYSYLLETAEMLKSMRLKKRDHLEARSLAMLIKRMERIKNDLRSVGNQALINSQIDGVIESSKN